MPQRQDQETTSSQQDGTPASKPPFEEFFTIKLNQSKNWLTVKSDCQTWANYPIVTKEYDQKLEAIASELDRADGYSFILKILDKYGADEDEFLRALLSTGVDPNVALSTGYTPLHICVQHSSIKCLTLLLQCRADALAEDVEGFTPRMLAEQNLDKQHWSKQAEPFHGIERIMENIFSPELDTREVQNLSDMVALLEEAESKRHESLLDHINKGDDPEVLLNLMRRKNALLNPTEYFQVDDKNMDVYDRALQQGRKNVAKEIRYRRFKAMAMILDSQGVAGSENSEDPYFVLDWKNGKKAWGLLADFLAWLVTENEVYLTEKVKRNIERNMSSWIEKAGPSGPTWLWEWFCHVERMFSEGLQHQDLSQADKGLVKFTRDLHKAKQDGSSGAAWAIWLLLTHLMKAKPTQSVLRLYSGMLPGKLWTWLESADQNDPQRYLELFADLIADCWSCLLPEDWPVLEQFFQGITEEFEEAKFQHKDVHQLLSSSTLQKLSTKLMLSGVLEVPNKPSTPDDFWKLFNEGNDSALALGMLRSNPLQLRGTFHDLQTRMEDRKDARDPADKKHIMVLAEKSLAIQMERLRHGVNIVEMAMNMDWEKISTMLKNKWISPANVAEEREGKNAFEWCDHNADPKKLSSELKEIWMKERIIHQLGGKTLAQHAKAKNWPILEGFLKDRSLALRPSDVLEVFHGKNVIMWCMAAGKMDLAEDLKKLLPVSQRIGAAGSAAGLEDTLQDITNLISSLGKGAFHQKFQQGQSLLQQTLDPDYPFKEVRKLVLDEYRTKDPEGFRDLLQVLTIDDALELKDEYLASLLLRRAANVTTTSIDVNIPLLSKLENEHVDAREKYFGKNYCLQIDDSTSKGNRSPAGHLVAFLGKIVGAESKYKKFAQKSVLPRPVMDLWISGWWNESGRNKHAISTILYLTCLVLAMTSSFSIGYNVVHGPKFFNGCFTGLENGTIWIKELQPTVQPFIDWLALWLAPGAQLQSNVDSQKELKDEVWTDCSFQQMAIASPFAWLFIFYTWHLLLFILLELWDLAQWIPAPFKVHEWNWQYFAWRTVHITAVFCVPVICILPRWMQMIQWLLAALAMVTSLPLGLSMLTEAMLPTVSCRKVMFFLADIQSFQKLLLRVALPVWMFFSISSFLINIELPNVGLGSVHNISTSLVGAVKMDQSISSTNVHKFLNSLKGLLEDLGEYGHLAIIVLAQSPLIVMAVSTRLTPGSKDAIRALMTERRASFLYVYLLKSQEGTLGVIRRRIRGFWAPFADVARKLKTLNDVDVRGTFKRLFQHLVLDLPKHLLHLLDRSDPCDFLNASFKVKVHSKPTEVDDNEDESSPTILQLEESGGYETFAESYFANKEESNLLKVISDLNHIKCLVENATSVANVRDDASKKKTAPTLDTDPLSHRLDRLQETIAQIRDHVRSVGNRSAKERKRNAAFILNGAKAFQNVLRAMDNPNDALKKCMSIAAELTGDQDLVDPDPKEFAIAHRICQQLFRFLFRLYTGEVTSDARIRNVSSAAALTSGTDESTQVGVIAGNDDSDSQWLQEYLDFIPCRRGQDCTQECCTPERMESRAECTPLPMKVTGARSGAHSSE